MMIFLFMLTAGASGALGASIAAIWISIREDRELARETSQSRPSARLTWNGGRTTPQHRAALDAEAAGLPLPDRCSGCGLISCPSVTGDLSYCPSAALSGPQDPDIDVAPPFGDPPDDDPADGDDLGPLEGQPSEAETQWAYDHLIRDTDNPHFWMPENRHAMRILRMLSDPGPSPAGDREAEARLGFGTAISPIAHLFPDQIARHEELVDTWLAAGCPGELPAWPELVTA
jgi:hypothetical protein